MSRYTVIAHADTKTIGLLNNFMGGVGGTQWYFHLSQIEPLIEALREAKRVLTKPEEPSWEIPDD